MAQCLARTKSGGQCRNQAQPESEFCSTHKDWTALEGEFEPAATPRRVSDADKNILREVQAWVDQNVEPMPNDWKPNFQAFGTKVGYRAGGRSVELDSTEYLAIRRKLETGEITLKDLWYRGAKPLYHVFKPVFEKLASARTFFPESCEICGEPLDPPRTEAMLHNLMERTIRLPYTGRGSGRKLEPETADIICRASSQLIMKALVETQDLPVSESIQKVVEILSESIDDQLVPLESDESSERKAQAMGLKKSGWEVGERDGQRVLVVYGILSMVRRRKPEATRSEIVDRLKIVLRKKLEVE